MRKGEGIGRLGMTVAIGTGVSGALVPQFGSSQKGTRSRGARWRWAWSGCADAMIVK